MAERMAGGLRSPWFHTAAASTIASNGGLPLRFVMNVIRNVSPAIDPVRAPLGLVLTLVLVVRF